jgi:hypothetical protein
MELHDYLMFSVDNQRAGLLHPIVKHPSNTDEIGSTVRNCF